MQVFFGINSVLKRVLHPSKKKQSTGPYQTLNTEKCKKVKRIRSSP